MMDWGVAVGVQHVIVGDMGLRGCLSKRLSWSSPFQDRDIKGTHRRSRREQIEHIERGKNGRVTEFADGT